jgi:hypothetical protein
MNVLPHYCPLSRYLFPSIAPRPYLIPPSPSHPNPCLAIPRVSCIIVSPHHCPLPRHLSSPCPHMIPPFQHPCRPEPLLSVSRHFKPYHLGINGLCLANPTTFISAFPTPTTLIRMDRTLQLQPLPLIAKIAAPHRLAGSCCHAFRWFL